MHFNQEDPIGKRITLSIDLGGGPAPAGGIPLSLTATIVGITSNVRQRDFAAAEPDPVAYLPYRDRSARVHDAARADRGRSRARSRR